MCRLAYKEGKTSREIYEKYFKEKISYAGFSRMWHGKNWKEIMPEVFKNNPHPAKKVTKKDIEDIRKKFDNGEKIKDIVKSYNGKFSRTTIYNIAHRITYKDEIHYKSDVSTIPQGSKDAIDTHSETDILNVS